MISRTVSRSATPSQALLRPQGARISKQIFHPRHLNQPNPSKSPAPGTTRSMSLIPRFPAGEFTSLFRLLDDYNDHIANRNAGLAVRSFAPRFDVRETKDEYILEGELPGIDQKNIDIEFTDPHTLVIKGKSEREFAVREGEQGKTTDGRYWVTERSIGEFNRTFSFPARIDQDKVKASLRNGILHVSVPKTTGPTARRITIE
ncbi:hypothetical protein VTN00DRAFT_3061 [Thermoascus crustaceus]|uniref:uncharacterized protein n=1 Tax=Thermoascus crustaceus TaxID=5088 RepID=UPI003743B070